MIKDNLILLRKQKGYSQEQVAESIDISRQAYAKWESGATVPDIDKCMRLAEMYGISIDGLVRTESVEGVGRVMPPPEGKYIWGSVIINDRGQIVIPKSARDKFNLTGGQRLIVLSDEEGIALLPAEEFEKRMKKMMELSRKFEK